MFVNPRIIAWVFCSALAIFGPSISAQDEMGRPSLPPADSGVGANDFSLDSPGPLKDVSFEVLWLIESDDANRQPYNGAARAGLERAGFGRLVIAGSARSSITIGQKASVGGASRYGTLSVFVSLMNTTLRDEVQVHVELMTKSKTPMQVNSRVRVPIDRWFLLGSADSRVGLPLYDQDGKRGVTVMRITDGPLLLD